MDNFETQLLNTLMEKYEKSVLSHQGSERNLSIRLLISDKTLSPLKDFHTSESSEETLNDLQNKGFIAIETDRKQNITAISLVLTSVQSLYVVLDRVDPTEEYVKTAQYLNAVNENGIVGRMIDDEKLYLNKHFRIHSSVYENLPDLKNLVAVIRGIEALEAETMERDFSVKILKDSKLFALKYRTKAAKIFKTYCSELSELSDDEALIEMNLVKNTTYVYVKNQLAFSLNDQKIDLDRLGYEFALNDEMIRSMNIQSSNAQRIITVENLTSFRMLKDPDAIVIFLSGFHNHTKQQFIRNLYRLFPDKTYYHFGDIDVGGMRIFQHLVSATGVPFLPLRMGIAELAEIPESLKALTEWDIKQLTVMLTDSEYILFHETISYMLKHKVKLEQELLD